MFTFKIIPDASEPFEVVAKSRDIVRWEKGGRGRSFGKFADQANLSYTDLYSLAHATCVRRGLYGGSLADFEDGVDVELVGEDADTDPTQPAR